MVATSEALTSSRTPFSAALLQNQIEEILRRSPWDIGIMSLIMVLYHMAQIGDWRDTPYLEDVFFVHGGLGIPGLLLFGMMAAFWGIRIWHDLPPGGRDYFLAHPISRQAHTAMRVLAGAMVLVTIVAGSWIVGGILSELIRPGSSYFASQSPLTGNWGWFVTFTGLVNAYLFATCLALLVRHPEYWLLIWIPGGLLALWIFFHLLYLTPLENVIGGLSLSMLAGFGAANIIESGWWMLVDLTSPAIVLIWLVIWSGAIWTIAHTRLRS